jgi:hypothetical protein
LAAWYDRAQAWLREANLDEPVGEHCALATFAACTPAQCRLMHNEEVPASAELAEFAALLQDYLQCYLETWKATVVLLLNALPPRLRPLSELPSDTKELYSLLREDDRFSQIHVVLRHSIGSFVVERSTVPRSWLHRNLLDPKVREDKAWEAMKNLIVLDSATGERRELADHCELVSTLDKLGRAHDIYSLPACVLAAACLELAKEAFRQRNHRRARVSFPDPELLQLILGQETYMHRLALGGLEEVCGLYERILAMGPDAARAEGYRLAALYGSEARQRFLDKFASLKRKREEDEACAQCLVIDQELKCFKKRRQEEYDEGVQLRGYCTTTRPRRDPFLLKKRGFVPHVLPAEESCEGLPAWQRTPPELALRACRMHAPSSFMLAQYHMTKAVCALALKPRAGGAVSCCIHPESFELLPVLSAAECDTAIDLYQDYRLPATVDAEEVAQLRRRLAGLKVGEIGRAHV